MLNIPGAVFISLEGGEGTGKTTQARLLAEALHDAGTPVALTREPGASSIGAKVRDLLLHTDVDVDPWAEAYLFAAERAQHVTEVITPALGAGRVVVCDRFTASSVVYQGIVRGLGADAVADLGWQAARGLVPDLTIVLDLDPNVSLSRAVRKGADRIEAAGADFHRHVRDGFIDVSTGMVTTTRALWHQVEVIDGDGTPQQVHERVVAAVNNHLGQRQDVTVP